MTTIYPTHTHGTGSTGIVGAVGNALRRVFGSVARFFDAVQSANRMASDYERLSKLSDAQLAARGLTRETLPGAVYKRYAL